MGYYDEVFMSDNEGAGCLIMMDANSWLGSDMMPNDPHPQNRNGKLFQNFLARNPNLTVLNANKLCQGAITRSRVVNGRLEKSIIDFVVICEKLISFFMKMTIDEVKLFFFNKFFIKKARCKSEAE